MSCEFCGRGLPQHEGRGRPKTAHPECKRAKEGLGYLSDFILNEVPAMSPEDQAAVRKELGSRLFSLINQMNRYKPNGSDALRRRT